MNILILGGTGYLGRKLIPQLLARGYCLTVTRRETTDLSSLRPYLELVRLIRADIDAIRQAASGDPFDTVINLCCDYGKNGATDRILKSNLEFPLEVLNTVSSYGIRRFITIGTGLPAEFNLYSYSKKIFADLGRFYAQSLHLDFFELRLEMFYGADEPGDRFIPSVIRKMLRGEVVNCTEGLQRRDIIAAQDIISAIVLAVDTKMISGYEEISVGTGEAPSISEIIDFIWKETGCRSQVNKGAVPSRVNEPSCVADTSIISSLGEWHPVAWRDGLRKMIKTVEKENTK